MRRPKIAPPVRLPNNTKIISGSRDRSKTKKREQNKKKVRGKEVSIRESASPAQVVYGRMRVGGIYTFAETSGDTKAFVAIGTGNKQIVFTARSAGASGNDISITIIVSGTNPTLTVGVVGTAITITAKSAAGVSDSTALQVMAAVAANGAANALVSTHSGDGTGTGNVLNNAETFLQNGGGTYLHQYITLCAHDIQEVEKLYLDNREVTFGASPDPRWGTGIFAGKVFMAVAPGYYGQGVQPDLNVQLPTKWTAAHKQDACAGAYILLKWHEGVFSQGLPDISFLMKGNMVYDPRIAAQVYSANAALIIADYLQDAKIGLGVNWNDIDQDALIEAANICDEAVSLAGGGTEARYEIHGAFDTDMSPSEVLEEMAEAIAGDIVYQGGKWRIIPGKWRAPTVTLTEDDLRSAVKIQVGTSRKDLFNCVRGTFVSRDHNYNEIDFPVIKVASYITDDGKEIYEDLQMNFVTNSTQCQRIAKIRVAQARQGIVVNVKVSLKGLLLQVGDTVNLTLAKYGWSSKIFEVRDFRISEDVQTGLTVDLSLRETAEAIYTWTTADELEIDPAPNTSLPDPSEVDDITGLTLTSGTSELYIRADGTVFSRLKASWTESTDVHVLSGGKYELQYKRTSASDWSSLTAVLAGTTFIHILDVQDGISYDVRVRAVNSLGATSDWATVTGHTVIGKTEPPSDVTGFVATVSDIGISFNWNAISDLDRSYYEIRSGTVWASGDVVGRTYDSNGVTSFLYEYYEAGTHNFLIKAVDTSGNPSTNAASVSIIISPPNPIQGFTVRSVGKNVLLDWVEGLPSTLTVIEYNVYKGNTESEAVKIGTVFGTFHTYIEQYGGTFTYWIEAVDVGENVSTRVSATAVITVTNDFYIQADQPLIDDVILKLFAYEENEAIYAPVGRATVGLPLLINPQSYLETWEEHFTYNGWTSMQDAIDDGYTAFLTPSPIVTSFIRFKYDYSVVFGSSFIDFSWTEESLTGGTLEIVPSIYVSEDDITYTTFAGTSQVFAENFRYVIFELKVRSSDANSVSKFSEFRGVLSLERDEETQIITANAGDVSGTTLTFLKSYLDVEDIQVSVNSSTPAFPVYDFDFSIVPAGSTAQIYVFDEDGNRITREVTARIRGAVNP